MSRHTKNIKGLIKSQFPEFYHEEGQVFIDFVSAYYDWMESKTDQLNVLITPKKAFVSIVHGSANIVGSNTKFLTAFSTGDGIAITRSETDYEVFTINTISNNTFLIIENTKLPKFAITDTTFGNVSSQANPGYYIRRTQDSLDVDTTTDEFVVWFKEMYLKNIQFSTITDTKTLIKHSLDLYRSKGTPRSVDLLFKIAFGTPAEIYYPSTDLFRLSSGQWHVPRYLELAPSNKSALLVNKQITGLTSRAVAFCDAVIRRTVKGKLIDVAYISAINGVFRTNELINPLDGIIKESESPLIVGSLNSVFIVGGGAGYEVGDLVDLSSITGEQGQGRVANVESQSGTIGITLIDGGYAYTAQTVVEISNSILTVSNVVANTSASKYFDVYEHISQPKANIIYNTATATPVIGDLLFTYHANNDPKGTGQVLGNEILNSTAGEILTTVLTGSMDDATVFTTANAQNFLRTTFTDQTATANMLGRYANVILSVTNITGTFIVDEPISQLPPSGGGLMSALLSVVGSNGTMRVENSNGIFDDTIEIIGDTSLATANIHAIEINIGVKDVNNTFIITANNYLTGNISLSSVNGTVTFISTGTGMSFNISNNMLFEEFVEINTDRISTNSTHYLPIAIEAGAYGLGGNPSGNIDNDTIENILGFANTKIGKIQTLTGINPGINYNRVPIIRIRDPWTAQFNIWDTKIVTITGPTSSFSVGEVVTQADTNFRGLVEGANSSELIIQRLRWYNNNDVIITTNTAQQIVGSSSGAVANVTVIGVDELGDILGFDAEIGLIPAVSSGVISELEIRDSGFGFIDGETVTWTLGTTIGSGIVNTNTHGTGRGFYKTQDGFLSNIKKLQDGEYWQTHSYEVRSSVSINKYADMLNKVVHVAGLGIFGNLVHTSTTDIETKQQVTTNVNSVVTTTYADNTILDRNNNIIVDRGNNLILERL